MVENLTEALRFVVLGLTQIPREDGLWKFVVVCGGEKSLQKIVEWEFVVLQQATNFLFLGVVGILGGVGAFIYVWCV